MMAFHSMNTFAATARAAADCRAFFSAMMNIIAGAVIAVSVFVVLQLRVDVIVCVVLVSVLVRIIQLAVTKTTIPTWLC